MNIENKSTCAHPACGCAAAADSKYCSTSCAYAVGLTEITCQCGHATCPAAEVNQTTAHTAADEAAMSFLRRES